MTTGEGPTEAKDKDQNEDQDWEEEPDSHANQGEEEEQPQDQENTIQMSWTLMYYLSKEADIQNSFKLVIAGYLASINNHIIDQERMRMGAIAKESNSPVRRRVNSSQTQSQGASASTSTSVLGDKEQMTLAAFSKQLVQGDLAMSLYKMVQKIQEKLMSNRMGSTSASATAWMPGARRHVAQKPALEFVKALCEILALDANVKDEVMKLKRDLLRLVGVGEFSQDAIYRDPTKSYIIPEMICRKCNHCRDLDLCRDISLHKADNEERRWSCLMCETQYDLDEIELVLLEALKKRSVGHCVQDLKCRKCNQVKESNLSRTCEDCGSKFEPLNHRDEINDQLLIFKDIAEFHKLETLSDAVCFLLAMNPHLNPDKG